MKPVTWFAPMWAFLCGAVASGATHWIPSDIGHILLGMFLAGPILCGASQVINDYFDRDVDAVNEPERLIPSGRISPGQIVGTVVVLLLTGAAIGFYLGPQVALFSGLGLILAILYSAPPFRAKRNGWIGNSLVAIAYEGLAWLAGHSAFGPLTWQSVLIAALYTLGAHGIMTINDFKSIEGDRTSGIRSIPVLYGEQGAAVLTVLMMDLAQIGAIAAFVVWQAWIPALVLVGILLLQIPLQRSFLKDPQGQHLRFSALGVSFYVWGMMVAAIGLRFVVA
jgi:chlorophyll synthase